MSLEFTAPQSDEEGLEITPLIDVIFQLLVFFMLTSTFTQPALDLTLPKLDDAAPPEAQEMLVLAMDTSGQLTLDGEAVTRAGLAPALQAKTAETGLSQIFFRGDAEVSYQEVLALMKTVNEAGVAQFNFIYEAAE